MGDFEVKAGPSWPTVIVVVLLVIAAGLIGVTLPYARNASFGTDAIQHGNEIASCRAAKAADVTDATTDWNAARSADEVLQNRFLEALVDGDTATLNSLRTQFAPVRAAITATRERMQAVNDVYQRAVRLAVSDPDRFVHECHNPPVTTTTTTERKVTLFGAVGSTSTSTTSTTAKPRVRRPVRRTTTTTRPAPTSTTGTTSTVPTTTTAKPCGLPPMTIPRSVPCPL